MSKNITEIAKSIIIDDVRGITDSCFYCDDENRSDFMLGGLLYFATVIDGAIKWSKRACIDINTLIDNDLIEKLRAKVKLYSSDKKISSKNIEQILPLYRVEIMQTPPIYSAIKVKGKKLYEYAREGKDVNIEARKVNIYKLELIEFNEEEQIAKVLIECSKGTYIRSIAHDLGTDLGCFGHLINLIRVKAGRFNISDSIKLEELSDMDKIREKIINPLEFLNYSHYDLNEEEKEKVSHGMNLKINKEDGIVILTYKNELISVAEIHDKNAKMKKVFI